MAVTPQGQESLLDNVPAPVRDLSIHVLEEYESLVSVRHLQEAVEEALAVAPAGLGESVSVVIAGDREVRELNARYRGLDETTDVLSFSFTHNGRYYGEDGPEVAPGERADFVLPPEEGTSIGEVIISYQQAERQAAEAGHSVEKELTVLLVHGVLHLLGHDHEELGERTDMEGLAARVLERLTVATE